MQVRTLVRRATLCLVLLSGCKGPVPANHTSLGLDPGPDPGKPARQLSMVWHHHSTGDELLAGGLLAALKADNIDFHDINYKEAVVDGYVIGDHTDPPDFPKNFNTPKYFDVIRGWERKGDKKQHDIIMFKSCFPASSIKDDAMLESYKSWYLSMLPTFEAHKDILFIAMSTPPLVKGETTPDRAKRARAWSRWITTEYPKRASNVRVFDLFNSLAVLEGVPDENTLPPQFAAGKDDSHPTRAGAQAMTRMFIPWFNRMLHEAGLAK
jgi:hypothetical protein